MRFRGDIEGLRAVAVLLVVAAHLEISGFQGGFVGVDVFFVISGFLITSLLLLEHETRLAAGRHLGGFSIPAFYLRRIKRILPAAAVVIGTTVVASHFIWNVVRADAVKGDAWWAILSGANFNEMHKATDYFQAGLPHSPLQHYWSLAVEEQFYLVWPFVLLVALKLPLKKLSDWRARVLLVLTTLWLASAWFSITNTAANPSSAYFNTATRAWELASGALLAVGLQFKPVSKLTANPRFTSGLFLAGFVAIAYSNLFFSGAVAFPGAAALVPVVGSVAVIAAGTGGHGLIRLTDNAVLRFFGRISYSLYLWHWPVILLMPDVLPNLTGIYFNGVVLAVTMMLSVLSYYCVEKPIRNLGRHSRVVPQVSPTSSQ